MAGFIKLPAVLPNSSHPTPEEQLEIIERKLAEKATPQKRRALTQTGASA